jgi:osmotically-inducible protein OsmY
MTDDGADKVPAGSEPAGAPERRSDEDPRGTRVGGSCLLFFIIAALSGGASFHYLYAREGSVSRAFEVLRASSEDAALSAKVKAAFALSKRVSNFDIGVSSRRGVVTLTGRVPTPHVRDLVEAIASNVTGVEAVQNEVSVDPAALRDPEIERLASRVVDLEIKIGVLQALQRAPELSAAALRVDVSGRSVILAGSATSQELSRLAEVAAHEVDGVQAVRNEIVVAQPEASALPRPAATWPRGLWSPWRAAAPSHRDRSRCW